MKKGQAAGKGHIGDDVRAKLSEDSLLLVHLLEGTSRRLGERALGQFLDWFLDWFLDKLDW